MDGKVSQFLTTVAILQLSWFTPAEDLNTVIFNDLPKAQTSFVLPSKHFFVEKNGSFQAFCHGNGKGPPGKNSGCCPRSTITLLSFFSPPLSFFYLFPSNWCFFHAGTATVSPGSVLGTLTNMSIFAYDYSQRRNALYNCCLCLKSISLPII